MSPSSHECFSSLTCDDRTLVVWADDSVSLLQQSVSVWTREEALGAVIDLMFVELPAATPSWGAAAAAQAVSEGASHLLGLSGFVNMQILAAKVGWLVRPTAMGLTAVSP